MFKSAESEGGVDREPNSISSLDMRYRMNELPIAELEKLSAKLQDIRMGVMAQFLLTGWSLKGLVGYMWLHGGILHLSGNALMLWVFGNAACEKPGYAILTVLYVVSNVLGVAAHLFSGGGAMLGTSGAIFGVVGIYLVFFPENDVDCVWVFFLPLMLLRPLARAFSISGYWLIIGYVISNIIGVLGDEGRVAHFAHLGGMAGGFTFAIMLLKFKMISMEKYEKSLLELIGLERKESEGFGARNLPAWQQEHIAEEQAGEAVSPEPGLDESETEQMFLRQQGNEFIRFTCACGKRIKRLLNIPGGRGGVRVAARRL